MIRIGETQTLEVLEELADGFVIGDADSEVWIPHHIAPDGLSKGDSITLFVHSDREGSPFATTKKPRVERGQFACLDVVDIADHGAYLDWGLDRDLFVPHGLQYRPLSIGDAVVVAVDVDEYDRMFASSRLSEYFDADNWRLKIGQQVELLVYGFNSLGAMVIIDGRYNGMIYDNETFRKIEYGEKLMGWVSGLREDGRVDVRLQASGKQGTQDATTVIWEKLQADGFLALTDKSPPAEIRAQLQMSKKAFKKAVGSLYKARKLRIEADGLYRVES